jgi:hypothetical protein
MNFTLRPVVFFKDDIGLAKSLGDITPLIGSWRPDPVALRVDGWSLLSQGCSLIGYDREYLIGNGSITSLLMNCLSLVNEKN